MKEYVVGFIFDEFKERVLLILKERPEWQKGKYNGIGGLIEEKETGKMAMTRECKEECGLYIEDWDHVLTLSCPNILLHYYRTFVEIDIFNLVYSKTDELVISIDLYRYLNEFYEKTVRPTNWILLMATDPDVGRQYMIYGRDET